MRIVARIRSPHPDGEGGFTLVAVAGTMAILTAFLLASLGYAVANLKPSRNDQDAKTAIAAAQAGVDDYIARLNANDTYFNNNNVDASNAAFTSGALVAGTAGQGATYSYRVLSASAQTQQDGIVRLLSTGKSRNIVRSVTAQLHSSGFLRYIYVTDLEATDPALYDQGVVGLYTCNAGLSTCREYVPASVVDQNCTQYYYAGRNYPTGSYGGYNYGNHPWTDPAGNSVYYACREIQFTGGDTINGPLHTNDALNIAGSPLFTGRTETSWSSSGSPAPPSSTHLWWNSGTPSAAGQVPVYAPILTLPSSSGALKTAAHTAVGCYYTGATRFTFAGSSMTVVSPSSTSATTPSRCLNTVSPIPSVIFVDGTSAVCSPAMGYPLAGEDNTSSPTLSPNYDCKQGTAYVSGSFSGKTTVSTANDIVITGDLTYASATNGTNTANVTDVLGLIASNSVWVSHPVDSSGNNLVSPANSVHNIHAAIMALNHSFLVQNYGSGAAISSSTDASTKLTVLGSIIQKFRGPVGTGNSSTVATGYLKNYVFDSRLQNVPPPYFLKPQSSPWGVAKLSDG